MYVAIQMAVTSAIVEQDLHYMLMVKRVQVSSNKTHTIVHNFLWSLN